MSDTSTAALNSSILMSAISTSTASTAKKAAPVESTAPKTSIVDTTATNTSTVATVHPKTSVADTTSTKSTPATTSTKSNESTSAAVYATKGDSKYKASMDINGDGTITNQEVSAYYAKIASSYGSNLNSLQVKTVGNVATSAQAANAYSANNIAYSTASTGTSFIETAA